MCIRDRTNPARDYHMEFACASLEEAQALCSFLAYLPELSGTPGVTKRKGQYVVYVKGSEQITDLLAFIGANKAAMEFMQVKMVKEVRNYVNRTTNFETANIGKTASAAAGQLLSLIHIYMYLNLIYGAKDYLYITTPYLIMDSELRYA